MRDTFGSSNYLFVHFILFNSGRHFWVKHKFYLIFILFIYLLDTFGSGDFLIIGFIIFQSA